MCHEAQHPDPALRTAVLLGRHGSDCYAQRSTWRQQCANTRERLPPHAIAKEPEVPHAHEPARYDMLQVASHELSAVERHDLVLAAIAMVAVAERHLGIGQREQPFIADRDAPAGSKV